MDSFDYLLNYYRAGLINQTPTGGKGITGDFLDRIPDGKLYGDSGTTAGMTG